MTKRFGSPLVRHQEVREAKILRSSVMQHLQAIEDPRVDRTKRHSLMAIITIAIFLMPVFSDLGTCFRYVYPAENIRLIFQPSHSPELMPVEHIGEDIRENHFYNQVFQTLDQVEDVLCQGLVDLCSDSDRLRYLTFFPHLRVLPLNAT